LIDLNRIPDETLKKQIWAGSMALTLKHIFAQDIQLYLPTILALLQQAEQQKNGHIFTDNVLSYILHKAEIGDPKTFLALVTETLSDTGETVMTIAEKLRKEGLEKGQQQAKKEIALRLLAQKMDAALVASCTGLTVAEVRKLQVAEGC
jgi:predicted transposase/invertase (TIGR01784 family)